MNIDFSDTSRIPTVGNLINDKLAFLTHSTQKRNLSYQIQLLIFHLQIVDKEKPYGGLETMFWYDILRLCSDIAETLLYCSLKEVNKLPVPKRNKPKLETCIPIAKKSGLISKTTAKRNKTDSNFPE